MWLSTPTRRTPGARLGALRAGFDLEQGMRVGLYGGSFNPAHAGHAHVAKIALTRLRLDRLIWLVSPQNPLKTATPAADLAIRMSGVRDLAVSPRMIVSDLEARMGAAYTVDTLRLLQTRYPRVRFVWIMGADNLASFHRWRGWTDILRRVPVAVIDRPGAGLKARLSPAARRFAAARRSSGDASRLALLAPPAWIYLTAPLNAASSTAIRAESAITISS